MQGEDKLQEGTLRGVGMRLEGDSRGLRGVGMLQEEDMRRVVARQGNLGVDSRLGEGSS